MCGGSYAPHEIDLRHSEDIELCQISQQLILFGQSDATPCPGSKTRPKKLVKPLYEHVSIPKDCSIRVFNREIAQIPFEWHHHPECELTLTLNSRGLRFIADHIGAYDSRDVVLVPSDMPHTWASTKAIDESKPHTAIVLWFTEAWALQIADVCPEYSSLRKLLKRASGALSFPSSAGEMMESRMSGLLSD